MFKKIVCFFCAVSLSTSAQLVSAAKPQHTKLDQSKHVILFIWDGLRPDSVTQENTPNLYTFMKNGVQFKDNHSSYPTFTMMNAASFATGNRAGKTGFFGNTLWHPGVVGRDAAGNPVDFDQPVFTEDYKILQDLDTDKLFFSDTLFKKAHQQQFVTAVIGKSGPAFMQDYLSGGYALDEKHLYPLSFAKQLQSEGYDLPVYAPLDFSPGDLVLSPNNGSPTQAEKVRTLADGVTPDASDSHGSPYDHANEYMMKIYINEILLKKLPTLSVVWLRNPDTTEHNYGPGTADYRDALRDNDQLLGQLLTTLHEHNLDSKTDIIVVSDHAHSTVSGPTDEFPLRAIKEGQVDEISADGYSVSGDVRSAELLTQAGFHAYDGVGCTYDPVLSGITSDKKALYPVQVDHTGKICGKVGAKYTSKSYMVPASLPNDAVIVAANGGTDYFYVPSHDKKVVENLVKFFASHKYYSSIFVDGERYGSIHGTIPLTTVGLQNSHGRSPDIIVGFSYDAETKVNGMPGIEFSDTANARGMHGAFSPIDVHNFMAANGPDFRQHFIDEFPSGNVDVAPTIAELLGLSLPDTDGRVLHEALINTTHVQYSTQSTEISSASPLKNLVTYNALNQRTAETQFSTRVFAKILTEGDNQYFYFDKAEGIHQ